jgi:cell division protein FtsI (penicillin-binding protein 3)/stage V sporulation protein D (sporulation-specific penicillin-binding protein)
MKLSEKAPRQSRSSSTGRINLLLFVIVILTGLVVYRLFNLTQVLHATFVTSARSQYNNALSLLSGRGNIYLSDISTGSKGIVATNKSSFFLYANSKLVDSAHDSAVKLAPIIKKDVAIVEPLLSNGKTYQEIASNLTKDESDQIKALKLKGLTVISQINRFYPRVSMAAPVLGFVGFDGNQRSGQYGIESYYDNVLAGTTKTQSLLGNATYSKIANFFKFFTGNSSQNAAQMQNQEGSDIVLTIDQNIQSLIEIKLGALLKKWSAEGGSIIVEDPNTGAILGMASSPSFDPNNYGDYSLNNFMNPGVQVLFEPGSSFKPITMSGAIDSGAVTPETTYVDTGVVNLGGFPIRNFDNQAHGVQTMRQVLEHSLNLGAMFAEDKTGDDKFLTYVVGFGFGQKTGVDLGGEISGNISNLYSGRKVNFATAAFGQGIAVTPLQLVNAYSAIANGGKLMRPYVVKEIVHPDGTSVKTEPKVIGAPITEKTSSQIKSMLVDVVDKGFDKARITGYDIAGKTGTAQIPDPKGGGYLGDNQFVHDFLGFAPAYAPRFVVLIKMDKPKGIRFAADSLSPVFGDIARYLIRYFNIPPTR